MLFATAVVAAGILAGCVSVKLSAPPAAAVSFEDYRREAIQHIQASRSFQLADHDVELTWNTPQEWRPSSSENGSRPRKGILLVHGLGDSPWSFWDLGQPLAMQGFLVRTVLLPGHGTRPEDLLQTTVEQWQQVVWEQANALQKDVEGPVYMGGFSTGANLVLDYAYSHPEIAGLVLFSPGFKSMPFDWLAPLAAHIRPWLITPDGNVPMQNAVKYFNIPANGFAQFYRTSANARRLLRERAYDRPVFMVVAGHDSVLDTGYLLDVFQRRFTHPDSRLIWYGVAPDGLVDKQRVMIRPDRLAAWRISQFSHMSLTFDPANPVYGEGGIIRICLNGFSAKDTQACEQGVPVWYSDWGYREEGKVHARLTFNPYFNWQNSVMATVLGRPQTADASCERPTAARGKDIDITIALRDAVTF
ncbi:alpha/beta fold hydrolase [Enterobacter cloacae complex sp. P38RS]|uniref:alpha/beta fold hydrolase n=1 Tax=Enterobacter cloacae complex sp. P38RS TaxID=2779553 RepID=UPI0018723727|nr:alpha/beta fold hydrolase [Enterobacter cloacae complex sp. P38RS]MBE4871363.1 alpha/beta fold hydrolase [Enterobacter cloacae complex sp. P38RS]